ILLTALLARQRRNPAAKRLLVAHRHGEPGRGNVMSSHGVPEIDMKRNRGLVRGVLTVTAVLTATTLSCTGAVTGTRTSQSLAHSPSLTSALPSPSSVDSRVRVVIGEPIDVRTLPGRIVLSSEDDVYAGNADGSGLVKVTRRPGPEFDPAWSPEGRRIVYRD